MPELRDPTRRLFQGPQRCGGAITVVLPYELGKWNRLQFRPFLGLRCNSGLWVLYFLLNSTEWGISMPAGLQYISIKATTEHGILFNLTGTGTTTRCQNQSQKHQSIVPTPSPCHTPPDAIAADATLALGPGAGDRPFWDQASTSQGRPGRLGTPLGAEQPRQPKSSRCDKKQQPGVPGEVSMQGSR